MQREADYIWLFSYTVAAFIYGVSADDKRERRMGFTSSLQMLSELECHSLLSRKGFSAAIQL